MNKNKFKRLLCLSISFAILIYKPLPITANEVSGICGNDISWNLNQDVGLLNISGVSNDVLSHHNMDNYNSYTETPWALYKDSIKSLNIGGRINNVGDHAFDNCTNLVSVILGHLDYPNFVGNNAFYNCENLMQFKYEGTAQPDCGADIFNGSKKLKEVMVPADYNDNEFCGLPIKRYWSGSNYGLIIMLSVVSMSVGIFGGFFGRLWAVSRGGGHSSPSASEIHHALVIPLD